MVVYHFGIGVAAILTSFAQSLIGVMMGLALIGVFALFIILLHCHIAKTE